MTRIKEVTLDCAKTTSLKGIPKVIKSERWSLTLLWLLGTLLLFTMCIYQVYIIVSEYASFAKVTTITEESLRLLENDEVRLPDILACNLSPFSSVLSGPVDIPKVSDYIALVDNVTMCTDNNPCTPQQEMVLGTLRGYLMSPSGYFQYIKKDAAQQLGNTLETFIASCQVLIYTGSSTIPRDCDGIVTFKLQPHVTFYQCAELHFPEATEDQVIIGVSLTFYLDNFNDPFKGPDFFKPSMITEQGSGVYIVLHEPGTFPIYLSEYTFAASGAATEISFAIESTIRLDEPYGGCVSTEEADPPIILGEQVSYSPEVCNADCIGTHILTDCGCIDVGSSHNILLHKEDLGYPYCYSVNQSRTELIKNIQCVFSVIYDHTRECVQKCATPCKENKYIRTVSSVRWPRPYMFPSFYASTIQNKDYASRFSALNKDCTNDGLCSTIDKLNQQYLIENNFAKVNVILGSDMHVTYEDNVKVSRESFLAQLGGVLNLWSGITLVVIIEVLEYIFKLFLERKEGQGTTKIKPLSTPM